MSKYYLNRFQTIELSSVDSIVIIFCIDLIVFLLVPFNALIKIKYKNITLMGIKIKMHYTLSIKFKNYLETYSKNILFLV